MNSFGTFYHDFILYLLPFLLVNYGISVISFPLANYFFGKFSDKGYSFSSFFGWTSISFILFFAITYLNISVHLPLVNFDLSLLKLTKSTVFGALILWTVINLLYGIKKGIYNLLNFQNLLKTNLLFTALFLFWYFVRVHNPQIYQIERFMDYGIIKSLFNAESLPLNDFWYVGEPLNYYYFGHFISFVILSISRVGEVPGFFVLVAFLFASLGTIVFRLSQNLFLLIKESRKGAFASGILSVLFTLFFGPIHSVLWLKDFVVGLFLPSLKGPGFWYAEATRSIKGTITEFPIFSFLEADVHAHNFGYIFGALTLSSLFLFYIDKSDKPSLKNRYLYLIFFFIGISAMTNTWDALTLGFLSVLVYLVKYRKAAKIKLASHLAIFLIMAFVVASPWILFFRSPVTGFGFVRERSPIFDWLLFWGGFVVIVLYPVVREIFRFTEGKLKFKFNENTVFFVLTALLGLFLLFFQEIFFAKDILISTVWFRANTVFKITAQVWLWFGILAGVFIVREFIKEDSDLDSRFRGNDKIKGVIKGKLSVSDKMFRVLIALVIFISLLYPLMTIQYLFKSREIKSIDKSLSFWEQSYPFDYDAYKYLLSLQRGMRESEKAKNIIEASGESYTDSNFFSVFLGLNSVIGWPVHEWTWRGSYDDIALRRSEVSEVYTGLEKEKSLGILNKYNIDYIIDGQLEKMIYGERIQKDKISSLGETIYKNEKTRIIKVK
ncbi:hypothetical protein A2716_00185 [candidate division WWE3 bacterium RIFCSPHIGHO2_01_FULL_40_23]|uniref:YYY membrane protein n=1 Tax=candidate division WWE3 bacterium RIFCSPLOWO2_01_FULL_41_18 TaxID=1802625 RepID=A0A1F4VE41_UNCKA|nr:MAG: hypothetical protein A2716_00185 [candidate division WWE3 bacterium RIFCSPHIGHO2_01_FULL_40_23]OGC55415.1 MAG: hypothetical protein A3A78_00455 [candidate division WWE3 bacterium RIFCSPLOWO2_01_FULL_41_18]